MLISKGSHKLFYQFRLNPTKTCDARLISEISNHIAKTWVDIEYLRFLFNYVFSKICANPDTQESKMLFNALLVLSKDFYLHFGIVKKLINKLLKDINNQNIKSIFLAKKKFWDKINDIRNHILVHKEKKDFFNIKLSFQGTHPRGIYIDLTYTNKEREKERIEILPLVDVAEVESFLKELAKEFNKGAWRLNTKM